MNLSDYISGTWQQQFQYKSCSPSHINHQWSWDAAFIAIGYSHYAQGRAQKELLSMFTSGMKDLDGFLTVEILKDYAGRDRVVHAIKV